MYICIFKKLYLNFIFLISCKLTILYNKKTYRDYCYFFLSFLSSLFVTGLVHFRYFSFTGLKYGQFVGVRHLSPLTLSMSFLEPFLFQ